MDEKALLEALSHGNIHLMKIAVQGMLLYLKDSTSDLEYVYNQFTQGLPLIKMLFPLKTFKSILSNALENIEKDLEGRDPCGK